MLPTPLSDLFIVNNTRHDYFTRQHNDLHIAIGLKENVYRLFSFHGTHIWNNISIKNPYKYHMPVLRIYQKCIYKLIIYLK